jgi:alpha,alpha-trehalose phosphorylase
VLTYANPDAARDILEWRWSTLDLARDRAAVLRLKGAAFPWRTIRGEECSGYWPAGTAAFHINGAVADGVRRYVRATGDTEFEAGSGFDLVIETARLFASLGHFDADGNFRIDGVTGPDEYTALVDNNVYTNLLAARNLRTAAEMAERYPERAADYDVDAGEIAIWRQAAAKVRIPFDRELGITAQSEGFTRYRAWDFAGTPEEDYPLLLHYPYYKLYSSQVIKQADLVLAHYLFPDAFTPEQRLRDFQHYETITVRDSSLSSSIQAIVAAEVGYLDLALEYLRESAYVDLRDLAGNSHDGLHLAAMCGTVAAIVAGFGGLRDHGERLAFAPRLPDGIDRICFRVLDRGRRLRVAITPEAAHYELISGDTIDLLHYGKAFTLVAGAPQEFPWPKPPELPPVRPPAGREPGRRGIGREGSSHQPPPAFLPAADS